MDQLHSPARQTLELWMKGEFHNSERSEKRSPPESEGVAPEVKTPPFSSAVHWEDPQFLSEQEEAEGHGPGIHAFLPA